MTPDPAHESDAIEADLATWGKVIVLETRGRRSGVPRRATIGFHDGPEGSLLVAASDDATAWARNLIADPSCHVERDGTRLPYRAQRLGDVERHAVIVELILKYGTPAERQGGGPAFRLTPLASKALR